MRKVILLNGAIRDTEEFILIIDYILYKKSLIKEDVDIIISTWHEDINNNIDLFTWIVSKGIRVVGSGNIDIGGPANIFRQWRTLDADLSIIPQESYILKGRTDKFLLRKDAIDAFLQVDLNSPEIIFTIENNQLAVEHVSISLPFMAKDMIYLGTREAMRKVVHYSVRTQYTADHIFNGIGPECFLWLESCSLDPLVMSLIQKVDLRQVSNKLMVNGDVFNFDWSTLDPTIVSLFRIWFDAFDKNYTFISDVIHCSRADAWGINEGSWSYQTGDRDEYEKIKLLLSCHPIYDINSTIDAPFINSTSIFSPSNETEWTPMLPFRDKLEEIRNIEKREYSDIVILRQKLISNELSKINPDANLLSNALAWNIRQRDRDTLEMVYHWMLEHDKKLNYVSDNDKLFVLERMLDIFTFSQNKDLINVAIKKLKPYFKKSASLQIRLAEFYFTKRALYRALYWFGISYRSMPNNLGVNHGLGCTLLDLGFTRLSLRFLKNAHRIMPSDQTAIYTLIRALYNCGKKQEASILLQYLSGNLRIDAERILNVK
ncbi:tetratricopeptide repeat protein [Yersinia enterocolitica]|uniref:tetratricopeptide repeat protein n=1 Tax=Yersinia enterocolitica TaxID=630 RepID=UPI0005E0ECFA|nr:hypothetical protein [Yersinia enterocolitica]CNJ78240.1 Uncharacterised protein [Yersinia enterocolitica]